MTSNLVIGSLYPKRIYSNSSCFHQWSHRHHTALSNIGRRQIWMEGVSVSIHYYTFSWNAPGHSIQKSILFLSVEIQNEIRVNLINEARWHHLSSFCSGAAELDPTAPLPPSNKYMDNCWPPLLDTLTSCLNNCGGTQLGQLLLLLLAVR